MLANISHGPAHPVDRRVSPGSWLHHARVTSRPALLGPGSRHAFARHRGECHPGSGAQDVDRRRGVGGLAQTAGQDDKSLTISRIGMSYHQAKMVMGLLHQALYDRDNPQNPRQLGEGK